MGKKLSDLQLTKTIFAQEEGITVGKGVDGNTRIYAFTPVQGTDKGCMSGTVSLAGLLLLTLI